MKRRAISRRYLRHRWNYLSQNRKGHLLIDGISVVDLAEKYGTPVYVMVEKEIRNRVRRFKKAFTYPKMRIQYAGKINTNLEILKVVREEGMELDASSVGEIILGLLVDFEPEQITFTNLYKTKQDIKFAAQVGVQAITADSLEELERINEVGEKLDQKIRIFIRINPMTELGTYSTKKHQYGIPLPYAKRAINMAAESKYLDLIGLHTHGSYISNPKVYFLAAKKMIKLAAYCREKRIRIKTIDLGGGFPVDYGSKKFFKPEDMGEKFSTFFARELKKYDLPMITLVFEPGKFIAANAGIGLFKVISQKKLGQRRMLITDGSTYGFLPDVLIYKAYYDILPATNMRRSPRVRKYDIAGNTCDSIDIIGSNRNLPILEVGDLLTAMDCGAYSMVMASNFNTLKRAPMVMIKENGTVKLIRRRDRYSEMFAPELDVLKVGDPNELKKYYNLLRVNMDKVWSGNAKNKKK